MSSSSAQWHWFDEQRLVWLVLPSPALRARSAVLWLNAPGGRRLLAEIPAGSPHALLRLPDEARAPIRLAWRRAAADAPVEMVELGAVAPPRAEWSWAPPPRLRWSAAGVRVTRLRLHEIDGQPGVGVQCLDEQASPQLECVDPAHWRHDHEYLLTPVAREPSGVVWGPTETRDLPRLPPLVVGEFEHRGDPRPHLRLALVAHGHETPPPGVVSLRRYADGATREEPIRWNEQGRAEHDFFDLCLRDEVLARFTSPRPAWRFFQQVSFYSPSRRARVVDPRANDARQAGFGYTYTLAEMEEPRGQPCPDWRSARPPEARAGVAAALERMILETSVAARQGGAALRPRLTAAPTGQLLHLTQCLRAPEAFLLAAQKLSPGANPFDAYFAAPQAFQTLIGDTRLRGLLPRLPSLAPGAPVTALGVLRGLEQAAEAREAPAAPRPGAESGAALNTRAAPPGAACSDAAYSDAALDACLDAVAGHAAPRLCRQFVLERNWRVSPAELMYLAPGLRVLREEPIAPLVEFCPPGGDPRAAGEAARRAEAAALAPEADAAAARQALAARDLFLSAFAADVKALVEERSAPEPLSAERRPGLERLAAHLRFRQVGLAVRELAALCPSFAPAETSGARHEIAGSEAAARKKRLDASFNQGRAALAANQRRATEPT